MNSYTTGKDIKVFTYQLNTALIIRSNNKFTFDSKGFSIEEHSGLINNIFVECIRFNSNNIVAFWEE